MNRVSEPTVTSPMPSWNDRASVFERDVLQFSVPTAVALAELNEETAQLNRTYLECIAERSLRVIPEVESWSGYRVRVFLRHDNIFVFAIAFQSYIGMANSVVLHHAKFCVNPIGREQTNGKRGPLRNLSTVHAWVQGTMNAVSNEAWPVPEDAVQVVYRPDRCDQFILEQSGEPVTSADDVFLVPGRCKVWARGLKTAASSASGGRP
ncbi:MAG: hypothetical protein ACK58L_17345 [Planctomycetota bacterium]